MAPISKMLKPRTVSPGYQISHLEEWVSIPDEVYQRWQQAKVDHLGAALFVAGRHARQASCDIARGFDNNGSKHLRNRREFDCFPLDDLFTKKVCCAASVACSMKVLR